MVGRFMIVLILSALGIGSSYALEANEVLTRITFQAPLGSDGIAIGNATTATVGYTSNNPATLESEEESSMAVHISSGRIRLGGGSVGFQSGLITLPLDIGTFQLAATTYRMSTAPFQRETGLSLELGRTNALSLGFGKKILPQIFGDEDALRIGVSAGVERAQADTVFRLSEEEYRAQSRGRDVTVGVVYSVLPNLDIGAYRRYSRSIAEGVHESSTTDAVGVTYGPVKNVKIFADWARLSGAVKYRRVAAGVEVCPADEWCISVGHNGSGMTAGVGYYGQTLSVAVGYARSLDRMSDNFTKEKSSTVVLTAGLSF